MEEESRLALEVTGLRVVSKQPRGSWVPGECQWVALIGVVEVIHRKMLKVDHCVEAHLLNPLADAIHREMDTTLVDCHCGIVDQL